MTVPSARAANAPLQPPHLPPPVAHQQAQGTLSWRKHRVFIAATGGFAGQVQLTFAFSALQNLYLLSEYNITSQLGL